MSTQDLAVAMPFLWPAIAAALILLVGRDGRRGLDATVFTLAGAGLGLGCVQLAWCWQTAPVHDLADEVLRVDRFSVLTMVLINVASFGALAIGAEVMRDGDRGRREFAVSILLTGLGLSVVVASTDLLVTLIGFELAGLALVALMASRGAGRETLRRQLLGQGLAFGLGAFGVALVQRALGETDLASLATRAAAQPRSFTLILGLGTIAVSWALRAGLAPFHFLRQDLAQESPATATVLLTTAWPLAGMAALARLAFAVAGPGTGSFGEGLRDALWWLALLSMSLGSLSAFGRGSLRRILAGVATARVGWMALALVAGLGLEGGGGGLPSPGLAAMMIAGIALVVGQVGAMALVAHLEIPGRPLRLDDLRGFGTRAPARAVALSVFVAVVAGIPGTLGFLACFTALGASLEAAARTGEEAFTLLAILGTLTGLVGLAACLRIPVRVFLDRGSDHEVRCRNRLPSSPWTVVVAVLSVSALWLGFGPELAGFGVEAVLDLVRQASMWMN